MTEVIFGIESVIFYLILGPYEHAVFTLRSNGLVQVVFFADGKSIEHRFSVPV